MENGSAVQNPEKPGMFYGWRIVGVCFLLLFFFAGSGFYSFSIFIKPLENYFGWTRAQISLTMSIYFFTSGIVGPFTGWLCQKYGPRRVMFIGAACLGACYMLVSLARSLMFFYVAYAIIAAALSAIGFIPVSSLLTRWFVRRRGTAIGMAYVGVSVGGLMLAPIVGLITARFGWQGSYIFLGICVWCLALPAIWFIIKTDPSDIGTGPDGDAIIPISAKNGLSSAGNPSSSIAEQGWPLKEAVKTRAFFWISMAFFFSPMAQMGVMQHQVPLIIDRGVTPATAAMALGIIAGMGGLGKLTFGRISETLDFHWVAGICFGLQALGVIILLSLKSGLLLWVYVAIFGFGMGGVVVLQPLAVGKYFGLVSFGVILGAINLAQAIGASIGAYGAGVIFDTFGEYKYALMTFVLVYLAATVSIFLAGKPRQYEGETG